MFGRIRRESAPQEKDPNSPILRLETIAYIHAGAKKIRIWIYTKLPTRVVRLLSPHHGVLYKKFIQMICHNLIPLFRLIRWVFPMSSGPLISMGIEWFMVPLGPDQVSVLPLQSLRLDCCIMLLCLNNMGIYMSAGRLEVMKRDWQSSITNTKMAAGQMRKLSRNLMDQHFLIYLQVQTRERCT